MNQRHVIPAVALLSALVVAGALAGPATVTTATAQEANASITYDDQQAIDDVTVESATLPEGGFVVVYNESGSHVGNSSYLDAGTHENLTVEVSPAFARDSVSIAEVHRDNGSDESFEVGTDGAYTQRGVAVATRRS